MLPSYFDPIRARLVETLRDFLTEKKEALGRVNALGGDAVGRLMELTLRGKMLRGCLVHLGWALCRTDGEKAAPEKATGEKAVALVGAAMELFQSGLLVHDDIMDRDAMRRGQPSIYHQYAQLAAGNGDADAAHTGQALGICAGDIAYFMAFELLARAQHGTPRARDVLGLCARELSCVGIAQMQDVAWAAAAAGPDLDDVLRMYTCKTGRYTFSLPLAAGAAIAGAPGETRGRLEALGDALGLLFQIRDDELGLFGTEAEIGKPVGSDVREGKKTILFTTLMRESGPADGQRLAGIFGNAASTPADIEFVRRCAAAPPVKARMDSVVARLTETVEAALRDLGDIGEREDRQALRGLLDFTLTRRQ